MEGVNIDYKAINQLKQVQLHVTLLHALDIGVSDRLPIRWLGCACRTGDFVWLGRRGRYLLETRLLFAVVRAHRATSQSLLKN